jgi:hypothetical protein
MDVAIRAVNWLAVSICARAPGAQRWIKQVTASLLLHARFIRSHLER